jgi:hypothetical protein
MICPICPRRCAIAGSLGRSLAARLALFKLALSAPSIGHDQYGALSIEASSRAHLPVLIPLGVWSGALCERQAAPSV